MRTRLVKILSWSTRPSASNVRYWRIADIGQTGQEWPLLTQSGHCFATQRSAGAELLFFFEAEAAIFCAWREALHGDPVFMLSNDSRLGAPKSDTANALAFGNAN